jgi:surface antigen
MLERFGLTRPLPPECTSFVAWRINSRLGISFTNRYKGQLWGNANLWGGAAQASGITVNTKPVAGSIAWDDENQHGAGSAGHVAWVAAVGSDTITIEEYNWNGGDMKYNTRTVAYGGFTGYIHIKV